jgi:hypothetical protein
MQLLTLNMKKTLILGALLAGAIGANAQGTVNFADEITGFTMHIYGPQASGLPTSGNAPTGDVPSGSTVYDAGSMVGGTSQALGVGGLANGKNVSVELYAAPGLGDAITSLTAVGQYTGTAGLKAGAIGLFIPNAIAGSDPGIPGTSGGTATVALAAWYNGGGAYNTLASAEAAGQDFGMSPTANINGLGGVSIGGAPPPTPPAIGVESFSIQATPEPSTIALGIMGASAFLFRRRMSNKI